MTRSETAWLAVIGCWLWLVSASSVGAVDAGPSDTNGALTEAHLSQAARTACATQIQALQNSRKATTYRSRENQAGAIAIYERMLSECIAKADQEAATRSTLASQAAHADQLDRDVEEMASRPDVRRFVLSTQLCSAVAARRRTLAEIAKERRYAKEAGVVNLRALEDLKDDLKSADQGAAEARAGL